MLHTYKIASEKDVLQEWEEFKDIFDTMLRQTIECQIFISLYTNSNYLCEAWFSRGIMLWMETDLTLPARLSKINVSKKTTEICQSFTDIEARFNGKITRTIAVVSIGTHTSVKLIGQG
jgi:hypothetical protein